MYAELIIDSISDLSNAPVNNDIIKNMTKPIGGIMSNDRYGDRINPDRIDISIPEIAIVVNSLTGLRSCSGLNPITLADARWQKNMIP